MVKMMDNIDIIPLLQNFFSTNSSTSIKYSNKNVEYSLKTSELSSSQNVNSNIQNKLFHSFE